MQTAQAGRMAVVPVREVTVIADERCGRPGSIATVSPGTSGKYGWPPAALLPGTIIRADSSAGSSGPRLLYQPIGASNLRAYVQGQDDSGHAALSN
jgi:hypothetical protein